MATNLPSCFFIQLLEQLLKFLVNFTLLKYVKSQRNYGFLITKELIFGFQILDLKDHFSASVTGDFHSAASLSFVPIYLDFLSSKQYYLAFRLPIRLSNRNTIFSNQGIFHFCFVGGHQLSCRKGKILLRDS